MTEADDTVPVDIPTDLYKRYLEVRQAYDDVKNDLDRIEKTIRDYAGDLAGGRNAALTVAGTKIAALTKVTTHRLDSAKLKREWPDIYREYTQPSAHWRLSWSKAES